MKIAHWTFFNASGLTNVAVDMCAAEVLLGNESIICDTQNPTTWAKGMDAELHVVHAHIPDSLAFDSSKKVVVIQHGSPEHVFENSVTLGLNGNYGASDPLAMTAYLLKRANAVVTFWPRQEAILRTMSSAPVFLVPMGVDKEFWHPVEKKRLLTGAPALLTAENCHTCKWPLDLMIMWPWIVEKIDGARAHFLNVPYDQHRWWLPLSYMNGSRYTTYISPSKLNREQLRDFLCACDYYYSPVQYGDFNRISVEAASCGVKVISYVGNPYASYWIREGDQREQARELISIFKGEYIENRVMPTDDIRDTAARMLEIYKEILT